MNHASTSHGIPPPAKQDFARLPCLNLLNKTAKTDSLKTRRKRAGWDDDYLHAVITQAA
jgi:hypothetical protein